MKFRIFIAAVLCALWAAAPLCAAPLRTVALSSDFLPGTSTGQTFGVFAVPILNDLGQTAFLSGWQMFLPSTNGLEYRTGDRAWSEGSGMLASVTGVGDAPPGVPTGVTIDFFNQIGFNDLGSTVLRAHLVGTGVNNTNDFATYLSNSADVHLITRTGDSAPTTPASKFAALNSLLLNNSDDVEFHCTVASVTTGNTDSVWLVDAEGLHLVTMKSGVSGGTTVEPVLNDSGIVAYADSNNVQAGEHGNIQSIAQRFALVPSSTNGETFGIFSAPVINSSGHIAFRANTSGPPGIWTNRLGSLAAVARGGDVAPGIPGTVAFLDMTAPVLSNTDYFAFRGTLVQGGDVTAASDSGIWADISGSLALVARENDPAPHTSTGTVFGQFDANSYSLNSLGQIAFLGRLTGADVTAANDVGIWATDQMGALQLVAREGDLLEVVPGDTRIIKELMFFTGTGNGDSRMSGFNELGQLAYWARFADNTEGFFDNSEGIFVSYAVAASIPGDFNHDGNVDSADYVAWRKIDGTQIGYNTWRSNFGVTSTPIVAEAQVVPEPTVAVKLTPVACALLLIRRRQAAILLRVQ